MRSPSPLRALPVAAALLMAAPAAAHGSAQTHVYPGTLMPVAGAPGSAVALFEIHGGRLPDRLIGVSSRQARSATLMAAPGKPAAALDVPAGKDIVMAPNAVHVRLDGLATPLPPGGRVTLQLRFERLGARTVVVTASK